jgi:protein SCO1/2
MKPIASCLLFVALTSQPVLSAAPHGAAGARQEDRAAGDSAAENYFGNVELIAHDGRSVRLFQDLIRGKTVVFSAFFSRCQGVCPPLNAKLAEMRRALGDRVGKDVVFASISVDPEFDTPERLHDYAARMKVGDGWMMLSGEPTKVRAALQKLGFSTDAKEAHSPLIIIGKERTGLWKKAHGFAPTDELMTILRSVLDDGE